MNSNLKFFRSKNGNWVSVGKTPTLIVKALTEAEIPTLLAEGGNPTSDGKALLFGFAQELVSVNADTIGYKKPEALTLTPVNF